MYLTNFNTSIYRFTSAMIGASLITLALLLFMHELIKMDVPIVSEPTPTIQVPIMEPPPKLTARKNEKPEQPPEPIEQPDIEFEPAPVDGPITDYTMLGPTFAGTKEIDLSGSANGSAVSMMQVAPNYPERARRKGIEGYVDLVFDLTATGRTQNIRIITAEPAGYFENASMRALKKWKYKPAMEDGKAIAMSDMTTRISYSLDN